MQTKPDQYISTRKIILSLILLLIVTLLSFLGVIHYSVTKVNKESRIATTAHLSALIEDRLNQQEALAKDYAFWDDTIKNAYLSQNPKWIKENIGEYLTDTFKITDLFIINSNDDAVLSLKKGQLDTSTYSTINRDALTALIVKARQSGPAPVPASGILMIEDTPALAGISVLTPEDGTYLPSPRPLLLLAIRLDSNSLQSISKQYRLMNLHFLPEEQDSDTESAIKMTNPAGNNLGRLAWQAENPGNLVLGKIQLPLLLLLIVALLITIFIINAARSTARRLEKAYADLAYNANHDALTGLANRRLFDELLKQTLLSVTRNKVCSAMLSIDLDNFKHVNDTYGHKTGDQLLITVAERIKNSLRESDITARMGGDEFAVILYSACNYADIETTVQKIISNLNQPFFISDNEVQIGASIGIVMIPGDGIDPDELMTKTDMALYSCKDSGKNSFRFYSELKYH